MNPIERFQQWRQRRARRREVAARLREFAIEGRALVDGLLAKGDVTTPNKASIALKMLAQCDFLDDLAMKTLRGEVEPRSKDEIERTAWPEVIG